MARYHAPQPAPMAGAVIPATLPAAGRPAIAPGSAGAARSASGPGRPLYRAGFADPRGQEVLPGPAAHGPVRGQIRAGTDRAGGLAGQPARNDRPVQPTRPQVPAD